MGCGNSIARQEDAQAEHTRAAQLAKDNIPTWKDVDIAQIEVKEMSGMGGSHTYKLSTPAALGLDPEAVAFHFRDTSNKALLEQRNVAASDVFSKAGIGPAQLADDEHHTWCIHEWGGQAISAKFTGPGCQNEAKGVAQMESMAIWSHAGELRECVGQLLGRIHSMATDWADPFIAQRPFLIKGKYPIMGYLSQKDAQSGEMTMPADLLDKYTRALDAVKPFTTFAQKSVNVHGDFHGANILIHSGANKTTGPRAVGIDFEYTNVGQAAFDLGYAFMMNKALLNNGANKRAFVKGYVSAVSSGESSAKDVENVLIDCELATVISFPPVDADTIDADTYEALVKRLVDLCSRAQVTDDPEKQQEAESLRNELVEKGAYTLIKEWHQSS